MKPKREIVPKSRPKRLRGTKKGQVKEPAAEQEKWEKASTYTQKPQHKTKRLRSLKQLGFPKIWQSTLGQADKLQHKFGFKQPCKQFKCPWHDCTLSWKGQNGKGRCTKNKCTFELSPTSFSLQQNTMLNNREALGLAYCFSLGTAPDEARHLCNEGGLCENTVLTAYDRCREVAAFSYQQAHKDAVFEDGEAEVDCTATAVDRTGAATTTYKGRMLGITERNSKKEFFAALPDVTTAKGDPPPPESYEDVAPHVGRLKDGSIMMPDSAGAYTKAKRLKKVPEEVPRLPVRHSAKKGQPKQFSRFAKVDKTALSPKAKAVARKHGNLQRGSSSAKYTAGTQKVDGKWGNTKDQMRRGNTLGRNTSKAHQKAFAALFLLESPGLENLGKASKQYFDHWAKPHGLDPKTYWM